MIEALYVAVPEYVYPRDAFDPVKLAYFEKLTGIHKTRNWRGLDASWVIQSAIQSLDLKNRLGHLDAVIVVTQTPGRTSPCVAMDVVKHLELQQDILAFDINQSCAGFVYGIHVAKALAGRSLVVCVDLLNYWDEEVRAEEKVSLLIFSHAISFTVVSGYAGNTSSLRCGYKCFPEGIDKLTRNENGTGMTMDGPAIFDWATKEVPEFIKLATAGFDAQALILHQANESMMDMIVKRSKFKGLVPKSINEYGNASMNSIPITIAMHEKELLGKRLLLVGYGAGFSLAGAALGWPDKPVSQLVEL